MKLRLRVGLGRDLDDEENEAMVIATGTIASYLHFPPEGFLPDIYRKYEAKINKVGGMDVWAARCILKVRTRSFETY